MPARVTHPEAPRLLRRKLWSYFIPATPRRATQRALERSTSRAATQIRPVVEAILKHPALYDGPRMVKPPAVYTAGLLRAHRRGIDTTAWAWLGTMAGQQLFYPPNVAGWDDSRWLDTATWRGRWWIAQARRSARTRSTRDKAAQPYDATELVARALDFWHEPRADRRRRSARCRRSPARALGDAGTATWKKEQYPAMTQNALRHLIAVSPDMQTVMSGLRLQRVLALARCSARPSRRPDAGCRRSSRACRCPPARASTAGASSRSARSGSRRGLRRLASFGRARSTKASPRAATGPPHTVLVISLPDGGADALSVLFPHGDPLYRRLRPKLGARRTRAASSRRTRRLRWHPSARGARTRSTPRGSSRCMPGDRLHERRPVATSRRGTTGRSGTPSRACGPAGSGATSTASAATDNPLQGCQPRRRRSRPRSRRRRSRSRRLSGPSDYTFWAPGVWGEVEDRMLDAIGALGVGTRPRHGAAHGARGHLPGRTACASSSRPSAATVHPPGRRIPKSDDGVPEAARRARRDARSGAAAPLRRAQRERRRTTRTPTRPGTSREGLELASRLAARVPARPRGARPRGPRARRSSGRSSAAAPRRTAPTAPTTAPPGVGLLIGLARARDDDRRVPRA